MRSLFRRHHTQATPCGPSRAALLTGIYSFNNRSIANGTPLDARHQTIAQLVQRRGYRPLLFGYTDTSIDPRSVPADDPRLSHLRERRTRASRPAACCWRTAPPGSTTWPARLRPAHCRRGLCRCRSATCRALRRRGQRDRVPHRPLPRLSSSTAGRRPVVRPSLLHQAAPALGGGRPLQHHS